MNSQLFDPDPFIDPDWGLDHLGTPPIPVSLNFEPSTGMSGMHFQSLGLARRYSFMLEERWASEGAGARREELEDRFAVLFRSCEEVGGRFVLESEGAIIRAELSRHSIDARILARTRHDIDEVMSRLRDLFPEPVPDELKPKASFAFWHMGRYGPDDSSRSLDVVPWGTAKANYPKATRLGLETLMNARPESGDGRLILWNGPPGTGKTSAIRSLAWEWRAWADFQYIVDPERFLGADSYYLVDMLMRAESRTDSERWFVVVLEDSGEMLAPDAREQVGQALSRLLNVGDGLLGQDFNLLALVTTNEPLERIHPAVARPGRCLSRLTFESFSVNEARSWLNARGTSNANAEDLHNAPLAKLSAIASNREWQDPSASRQVGFSAP